ncbi:PREDICTED: hydroxyacid oxidase 1-like [Amphimedon queenslandica]|uniref:(S)-2-hydroxy-acid oxidase n=1 Tax=Amphimedon queenslandica TaxID=400682 RepID=A0AAN0JN55_AMPQE|nr:PREDICTED: hydroxyacid oxidase 1-like [Amphimedon queenslandica]|eukprot:XP_019858437.1 PREDICTED: hydroxyacid oxidase 1-like [Amphimedon queenslandica]
MATKSLICLEEYEEEARSILDRNAWGYYSSGATTEYTLRDNVQAYNRYSIFPRVLVDVSLIDMSVRLLGDTIDMPIGISPTAMQCLAHPDGEKATARAAARMGTCLTLSSWSTTNIEEVAKHNGSHSFRWFQLYVYKDNNLTIDLVRRAEREGFKALVVTVDTPELGLRYGDKRNKFSLPRHLKLANFSERDSSSLASSGGSALQEYVKKLIDPSLVWDGIDWLRSITRLPIVLKGVLRADDAREAMKHDIQGILVSNHGARQLDTVPATVD